LQFWDKSLALDLSPTGNAGQAMQFIATIAPTLVDQLPIRGLIISLFDLEMNMVQLSQQALDLNLVPHASSAQLANAIFRNVTASLVDAPADLANVLTTFIDQNGQAAFIATVAGLSLNVDLVGLSQTGLEFV